MRGDIIDVMLLAVAAMAFASLAAQLPGMLGFDGIEPVESMLRRLGGFGKESFDAWEVAGTMPTLLWWAPAFGMPADVLAQALLLAGFLACCGGIVFGPMPLTYVIAWAAYLSVYIVGGTMMSFQWDSLLLEVLIGAALHAPLVPAIIRGSSPSWGKVTLAPSGHSLAARWLLRGTLFKLMFMAGAVKILSKGPTWLALTALNVHFQGQCLPHALSWWVAQLPQLVLKAGVAATLLVEGPMTLMLLVPFRPVRMVACWLQALLQVLIMLTGSFNFFNFLALVLIALCAADDFAPASADSKSGAPEEGPLAAVKRAARAWAWFGRTWFGFFLGLLANIAILAATIWYGLRLEAVGDVATMPWWRAYDLSLSPLVTPSSVQQAIAWMIPRAAVTVLFMMVVSVVAQAVDTVAATDEPRPESKALAPTGTLSIATDPRTEAAGPADKLSPLKQASSVSGIVAASPSKSARKRAMRRKGKEKNEDSTPGKVPAALEALAKPSTPATPPLVVSAGCDGEEPTSTSRACRVGWISLRLVWLLVVGACCICIHAASTFAMALNIGGAGGRNLVPVGAKLAQTAAQRLHNWHVTSVYGLFRQMTGVGPQTQDKQTMLSVQLGARPEIVVEATRDRGATWQTIHFAFKPTDLSAAPRLALPHQPRLDWQMWFAALGSYEQNPWLLAFVDKLLEGSPPVMQLLDLSRWPYIARDNVTDVAADEVAMTVGNSSLLRPQAIRCRLVHMDFTRLAESEWVRVMPPSSAKQAVINASIWPWAARQPTGSAWWYLTKDPRDFRRDVQQGREYLVPLTRGHEGLGKALQQAQLPRLTPQERAQGLAARSTCEFGEDTTTVAKWTCIVVRETQRFWSVEAVGKTLAVLIASRVMVGWQS